MLREHTNTAARIERIRKRFGLYGGGPTTTKVATFDTDRDFGDECPF
jgi:hypothetical protein